MLNNVALPNMSEYKELFQFHGILCIPEISGCRDGILLETLLNFG